MLGQKNIKGMKMKQFNKKFTLQSDEYLSSIIGQMEIDRGITCIVASVGSGKTTDFVNKPNTFIAAPLISIKQSEIDKGAMNIYTWQAIVLKVMATADKGEFRNTTLVVDESHGLYMDFNYKPGAIRELIGIFKYFKAVVVMSGTLDPNHITSFPIDRSYSVYKPQRAYKVLDTYIYTKNGLAALEAFIQTRKGQRKTLVLLNDKGMCDQLASHYGDRALVVNAAEKANDDVLELYASRLMGSNWDIIFGTNSIREGLSIEDDLDEVDVIVYGHTDPDVIEQFSNRFRNVSGVKHVHYFTPNGLVKEIIDFDIDAFTDSAKRFGDIVNEFYSDDKNDEQYKDYLRTAYHEEAKGSHLRYDKESDSFIVDLISVDSQYYNHRKQQVQYDPVLFEDKMMNYDFSLNPKRFIDGDDEIAQTLKDAKKAEKDRRNEERNERLSSITESFTTGKFHYKGDEEYDYIVDSIYKLITKGLTTDQIKLVVDGVCEDKNFIRKVWSDYNFVDVDTSIRNQLLHYIAKECPDDELTPVDTYIMASLAMKHTLKEFFRDDEKEMRKNKEWSKLVDWKGGRLEVKTECEVRVINKYITLGDRIRRRPTSSTNPMVQALLQIRKTDRYNAYPVKFTNLTGFQIDAPEATEELKVETEMKITTLKARIAALRG